MNDKKNSLEKFKKGQLVGELWEGKDGFFYARGWHTILVPEYDLPKPRKYKKYVTAKRKLLEFMES